MKKFILLFLSLAVVLACGLLILVHALAPQKHLRISNPEAATGKMLLSGTPLVVEVMPGMKFKIDTGADYSTINSKDLERLREAGVEVKPKTLLGVGRDGHGSFGIHTDAVSVNLPLYEYDFATDSLGRTIISGGPREVNAFTELDLFVTPDAISTLGIDMLEKFLVEYLYTERAIAFHNNVPAGFQRIVDIETSYNPLHKFLTGNRYYMNIGVDHIYNDYFLDTGQQLSMLKLPPADTTRTGNTLRSDTVRTMFSTHSAKTDDRAWIEIGHRAGYRRASYYKSEEAYGVNPFNIFTQDMLLDFPAGMIYLRPYCVPNAVRNIESSAVRF